MSGAASRIDRIAGRAVVLPGDDIDTDRVIPARFLKAITFDGLGDHVFEDDRRQAAAAGGTHPLDASEAQGAAVLVVGTNFGCGSSREHAPRAIALRGFRAIVGRSFAEIFFSNAVAIGLPCVAVSGADHDALVDALATSAEAAVEVDLDRRMVSAGDVHVPLALPDSARDAFLTGQWDATGLLLQDYDEVERVRATLPYI